MEAVGSYNQYLGLSAVIGKSKKQIFANIQDRLWQKISGWKEKGLSQARREILIKTVAQAIPIYVMGCLKIPVGCCFKMETLMKQFWWGEEEGVKKIH